MTFDYEKSEIKKANGKTEYVYRPILPFFLAKNGLTILQIEGLLDSGADIILFPLKLAEYFEVPYQKGEIFSLQVAGGGHTSVYRVPFHLHKVKILIAGKILKKSIDFCDGQSSPLLGQTFFEHFRINFDRKKKIFELQ